jgi:hypothetical protein
MKLVVGNRWYGPISKRKESALRNPEIFTVENKAVPGLYFAKSRKCLIDTADISRSSVKEITIIYLSFANVRISIALPGGGVSLEGGTSGTGSRW